MAGFGRIWQHEGMITTLLALSALVVSVWAVGVALMLTHTRRAPEGYEDASGFHRGAEPALAAIHHLHENTIKSGQNHLWSTEANRLAS